MEEPNDRVGMLENATAPNASDLAVLRGSTVAYTRVIRLARTSEKQSSTWQARIELYGVCMDLPVAEQALSDLVAAQDLGRPVAVRIDARWVREDDGSWSIDAARSLIEEVRDSDRVPAEPGTWSRQPGVLTPTRAAQLLVEEEPD